MIDDSGQSFITFTGVLNKDGETVSDLAPSAWSASTPNYPEGAMATLTQASKTVTVRCTRPHKPIATGLTYDGTSLGGPQKANWEIVPAGNFARYLTWEISESSTSSTYREGNNAAATTWASSREDTATLTGNFDPDEKLQKMFTVGNTATMNIYPQGTKTGKPVWTGAVLITGWSSASNYENPVAFTVNLSITGNGLDRTGVVT